MITQAGFKSGVVEDLVLKEVRWNKKEFLDMEVPTVPALPCRLSKWKVESPGSREPRPGQAGP